MNGAVFGWSVPVYLLTYFRCLLGGLGGLEVLVLVLVLGLGRGVELLLMLILCLF